MAGAVVRNVVMCVQLVSGLVGCADHAVGPSQKGFGATEDAGRDAAAAVVEDAAASAPAVDSSIEDADTADAGDDASDGGAILDATGERDLGDNYATGELVTASHLDMIAQPIVPDADMVMEGCGIRTGAVPFGSWVWFTLHEDLNGEPGAHQHNCGTLRLEANSENYVLENGGTPAERLLEKGKRYWIVTIFSVQPGQVLELYAYPAGGESEDARFGMRDYGFPGDLAPGDTTPGTGARSIYVRVTPK
jgi:hypothetical protein